MDDGRPIDKFGRLWKGYKFTVVCIRCKKPQSYKPHGDRIKSKTTKTCIFCGKQFRVKPQIIREAKWGEKAVSNKKIDEIKKQRGETDL